MSVQTEKNLAYDLIINEINRLGLTSYIKEIDEQGFTVIPPEISCPDGLEKRILQSILDVSEKRSGIKSDIKDGSTHKNLIGKLNDDIEVDYGLSTESVDENIAATDSPIGDFLRALIFEGKAFEDALLNPVVLAMATYLLGYNCHLSAMNAFIKGPNRTNLDLHCDTLLPDPLPDHALVCNCTYALTDYNKENGSIAFVPGSHKFNRAPNKIEAVLSKNSDAIHIDAKAGSLIVFHGAVWHGAYNRVAEGLRVTMPVLFARPFMKPEEYLKDNVSEDMIERINNPRFPILTQQADFYSCSDWKDQDARKLKMMEYMKIYNESLGGVIDTTERVHDHYA